jgi:hypothetical protein
MTLSYLSVCSGIEAATMAANVDDQFAADIAAQRARQMNAELPDATRDMLKLKGMI